MKKTNQKHVPPAMERREFLGVGAAMGASAFMSGSKLPPESDVRVRAMVERASSAHCEAIMNNVNWAIPAEFVTTLWTLLWPRVAARVWKGDAPATFHWPQASPHDPADLIPHIREWIAALQGGAGTDVFKTALGRLDGYLATPAGRVPIRLLGVGGYEFYMCEEGLELWAPQSPDYRGDARRQLIANYEYRRTGRPPIAIGGVMETAGILPEAPMGPGQIETVYPETLDLLCVDRRDALRYCGMVSGLTSWLDDVEFSVLDRRVSPVEARRQIDELLMSMLSSDPTEREDQESVLEEVQTENPDFQRYMTLVRDRIPRLAPHRAGARLEQIQHDARTERIGSPEAREQLKGLLLSMLSEDPAERRRQMLLIDPVQQRLDREVRINWGQIRHLIPLLQPQTRRCRPLPSSLYEQTLIRERCWAVSGSVFRGILEQFPRFVAETWGDDLDHMSDDQYGALLDGGRDVREMFLEGQSIVRLDIEERMETKLPVDMRFQFLDHNNPGLSAPPPLTITAGANRWEPKQLMITNAGFFFPWEIGNQGRAEELDDLLDAIIDGRAGNPVFTDSSFSQ